MQKFVAILLCIFSVALCDRSGVKFGIDTEIFKAVKLINFTELIGGQILVNETEVNGTYLFKYDLKITNLSITEITNPDTVEVTHSINEKGHQVVHLNLKNIAGVIRTGFYVTFGIFKESGNNTKITVKIDSVSGEFYFNEKGEVFISDFTVQLSDLEIDFESSFIKFLYSLARHLIMNKITEAIKTLNDKISTAINDWVSNEFLYDLGFGIGFNLTNIDRPVLIPVEKEKLEQNYAMLLMKLGRYFFSNSEERKRLIKDNAFNTTILECGIHGSVYPNMSPERAAIPEPVEMKFKTDFFNNEIQILLSDYTVNTLLFMGQQTGYLHYEFTSESNKIFPFDFNTTGISSQIPEYGAKYGNDTFPVEMQAFVKIGKNTQPLFISSENGAKIKLNFGLKFLTTVSDDPFDDPVEDLYLNITATWPLHFIVNQGVLSILLENFDVENVSIITDELNINVENFEAMVEKNINEVITPILGEYIKNIHVADLLKLFLHIDFTNMKLVTQENYIIFSIGIEGLNK